MSDGGLQENPGAGSEAGSGSGPEGTGAGEPTLDLGLAPAATPAQPQAETAPGASGAYRVLARKFRPSSFEDLIGQDALVRTLSNAFKLDRIHQAYLLTGVRGVGKTTTARILARAFNYELPAREGQPAIDRPTIDMKELGIHCQDIIESRHVDVIEMDAASHTGVDDMRELIEGARYRPAIARYKVYIIDEVHMLSKSAFNALLKTLEEPPEHVKFLFATTESEKIPVTVRSRCQRFDLRRVEADVLVPHLQRICQQENVAITDEALALIARAAEGSVRDSLSLLDQAIAHFGVHADAGDEGLTAETVRGMLGLSDRTRIIDLFEHLMGGRIAEALESFRTQYDLGADPTLILSDLAEFIHFVTRLKLSPDSRLDITVSAEERDRGSAFAGKLSLATLTRAWQLLSKGLRDVKDSPRPLAAAEMVLVRLAYGSTLPTPEDALRRLAENGAAAPAGPGGGPVRGAPRGPAAQATAAAAAPLQAVPQPSPGAQASVQQQPSSAPRVQLGRFEDVVTLAQMRRDIQLKTALEHDVRLVRFEQGTIEIALVEGASPRIAAQLTQRLQDWTGERWVVVISSAEGARTLHEQARHAEQERLVGVRANPLVQSVLEQFPGAEIVAVRNPQDEAGDTLPPVRDGDGDEVAYEQDIYTEDDL